MICLDVDHVRSFVCVKLYSEHMLDREIRLLGVDWSRRDTRDTRGSCNCIGNSVWQLVALICGDPRM